MARQDRDLAYSTGEFWPLLLDALAVGHYLTIAAIIDFHMKVSFPRDPAGFGLAESVDGSMPWCPM